MEVKYTKLDQILDFLIKFGILVLVILFSPFILLYMLIIYLFS